jgi:hypothetical protein
MTLMLAGPFEVVASAAGVSKAGASPAAAAKAPEGKRPVLPAGRKAEFLSAMILWCVIVFVGLTLVAMVMVWGRRLRRAVRRQPAAPTVPDPLWYLKKSPSVVTQADRAGRRDEKETGPDSGGRPST